MLKQTSSLAIAVRFDIKDDGIHHIHLQAGLKPGIQWEIGPISNKSLEKRIEKWIEAYKAHQHSVDLPLVWPALPPFTRQILEALKSLSFGESITYQQLAAKVGNPKAIRAAGTACGRNSFPLVIPCHRILGSQGKLGGFTSGIAVKGQLLAHEGIKIKGK